MELVEVDPELFISCRLCLDDKGIYQIIPCVKDQIHYCFDITVEQYDGLPQLLCRKCKSILVNFYETKKRYKEKQDKLIETKAPKNPKITKMQEKRNMDNCVKSSEEVKKENLSRNSQNSINHNKEKNYSVNEERINNIEIVHERRGDENLETKINTENVSGSLKDKEDENQESKIEVDIKTSSETKTKNRKISKRRKLSISSTSSNELDPKVYEHIIKRYITTNKTSPKTFPKSFLENHCQKRFICKYCNLICETRKGLFTHKISHGQLVQQCNTITNHCKVTMQIFDKNPSFTNQNNIVALDKDKFVQDDNNLHYYVLYTSGNAMIESEQVINSGIISKKHKRYECLEVISSDEEYTGKSKLRKKIRLVSMTPPVALEVNSKNCKHSDMDDNNNKHSDSETKQKFKVEKSKDVTCINIDDTSTDVSEQYSGSLEPPNVPTNDNEKNKDEKFKTKSLIDYTITNTIYNCYNKHLKQMENNLTKEQHKREESQNDRHELLSFGRKVKSKWGITSLPLLQHLQQNDLKIVWISTSSFGGKNAYIVGKEAGYINIQTIAKNSDEDNLSGFQICNAVPNDNYDYTNILPVPTLNFANSKTAPATKRLPSSYIIPKITSKRDPILGSVVEEESQLSQPASIIHRRKEDVPSTTMIKSNQASQERPVVLSQLLNANPVANPKQAPKKKVSELNVDKSESEKAQISQNTDHDSEAFICLDSDDDEDVRNESENRLPVIKCIKSLLGDNIIDKQLKSAQKESLVSERQNVLQEVKKEETKIIPRIKCKPVSELMAVSASDNLQQQSSVTQDSASQQQTHIFPAITLAVTTNSMANVPLQTFWY